MPEVQVDYRPRVSADGHCIGSAETPCPYWTHKRALNPGPPALNDYWPARPIGFRLHSLGGLLEQAQVLRVAVTQRRVATIRRANEGVAFVATPHAGADLASIQIRLGRSSASPEKGELTSRRNERMVPKYPLDGIAPCYYDRNHRQDEPDVAMGVLKGEADDPGLVRRCRPGSRDLCRAFGLCNPLARRS